MRSSSGRLALTAVFAALSALVSLAYAAGDSRFDQPGFEDDDGHGYDDRPAKDDGSVQLGPRPYYLVKGMDDSDLKKRLLRCQDGPFRRSDFSIGHRGATLQFPEHTKESYEAAARMGAGIVECDVTFTNNKELVCRHSECDLHTTTDIVTIPELNQKCSVPYTGRRPYWCRPRFLHAVYCSRSPEFYSGLRRVSTIVRPCVAKALGTL